VAGAIDESKDSARDRVSGLGGVVGGDESVSRADVGTSALGLCP